MRILLKLFLAVILVLVLVSLTAAGWFFLYSGDLPDTAGLSQFTPAVPGIATRECPPADVPVVPYSAINTNLIQAVQAAEVRPAETPSQIWSEQIAAGLFCNARSKTLKRLFNRMRVAIQLRRRFSERELLAIYLNRAYFGDEAIGIQSACQRYFRKSPSELSLAEAALIAGLLQAPSQYSPNRYPDRALHRRNEVLDVMLAKAMISTSQAEAAKLEPLVLFCAAAKNCIEP